MKLRAFGRTGLDVPPIGLGGFPFGGVHRTKGWDPFSADGRRTAIATIHRALERGINYVDTAPSYGDGNSESIFGEALQGRRDSVTLATKCAWNVSADDVISSLEQSLRRLRTDFVDVLQLHGGMFTGENVEHIMHGGPLDALRRAREQGKVRFIGFTAEEPWTARPLIASGAFDVVQLRYNLIYQSAALHALPEARDAGLGVAVMRPMTSGMLQRILHFLKPEWRDASYVVALQFVLSDSRVHVANVGMRWPDEVDRNVDLAERFEPPTDFSDLPRLTAGIYRVEDQEASAI
ncbi:MAG TPA: aldo/keto reductase [Chloroflexota bacterium]|nr:aldo/keto reductase [Chloroflexota bacterium]